MWILILSHAAAFGAGVAFVAVLGELPTKAQRTRLQGTQPERERTLVLRRDFNTWLDDTTARVGAWLRGEHRS